MSRFDRVLVAIVFLGVFIAIIALLLGTKDAKADYMPDVDRAIRMSQEARRSHAQWVFYYRTYPVYRARYESTRGTMEFHLKWVAHYDRVIVILQRVGEPVVQYVIPAECYP